MSEQDKRMMSPDEVRARRETSFAREVADLVESWRKFIANAMLAGEYNCVTSTIASDERRRAVDAARDQLEKELQAVGWKSLCWQDWHSDVGYAFNQGISAINCAGLGFGPVKYVELMWSAG